MELQQDDKLLFGDDLFAEIERQTGLRFSRGTRNKLRSPSRGEGPRPQGYVGRRPVYSLKEGIRWALDRVRAQPYNVHQGR